MTVLRTSLALLALAPAGLAQPWERERPAPPQETPYRLLDTARLERFLAQQAQAAVAEPTFTGRAERMAEATARMNAVLIADALGALPTDPERVRQVADLRRELRTAGLVTGEAFAPAFDAAGRPIQGQQDAFKRGVSGASTVAWDSLRMVAGPLGLPTDPARIEGVVSRATPADVAAILQERMGLRITNRVEGARLREAMLASLPANDYFRAELERMPAEGPGLRTAAERSLLEVGLRLANHTWMTSQGQRAAVPGQEQRIDPSKQQNFRPFDGMLRQLFETTHAGLIAQGVDPIKAELMAQGRVVAEVTKDLLELKKAMNLPRSPEEKAQSEAALRDARERVWSAELARMTVAGLVVEARRRGIDPGQGPWEKAALIEAIGARVGVRARLVPPTAPAKGFVDLLPAEGEKTKDKTEPKLRARMR